MKALGWIYLAVYELLALAAAATTLVAVLVLRWLGSKDPYLLGERLGLGLKVPGALGPRIWVHGASLGEVGMLRDLAPLLRDKGFEVMATATTRTGTRALAEIPGLVWTGVLPLDAPFVVDRFIARLRPGLLVLLETELWPALMEAASGRGLPILVVNGRMSARGFTRYRRWIRPLIRLLLSWVSRCLARSGEDLDRYVALGLKPGAGLVSGDLKGGLNLPDSPRKSSSGSRLSALGLEGGPVVVAGSIHPGEGAVLGEAVAQVALKHPGILLVAVPRHLERSGALALEFEKAGQGTAYKSQGPRTDRPRVILWDAYGELAGLYGEASLAIIGGSFISHGGQNPLEPARLGIPAVYGPHMENFKEAAGRLLAARGAVQVEDAAGLARALETWLSDPGLRDKASAAARASALSGEGALRSAVDAAESLALR